MSTTPDWFAPLQAAIESAAPESRISLWQQAVEDHPDSPLPALMLAAECAHQGASTAAEEAYCRALVIAPGLDIARFQLGLLQICQGRTSAAQMTWQPLLSAAEPHALKTFVQGFLALAQDQFTAAREHFEAGLAQPPDNPALKRDIQRVLEHIQSALAPRTDTPTEQPDYSFLLANYHDTGKLH